MSDATSVIGGSFLGAARAEADAAMLSRAFVETSDFLALRRTAHFNFVVGRRGTGKTALFLRLNEQFQSDKSVFSHFLRPEEHDSLALLGVVQRLEEEDYGKVRPTMRVLWRASILSTIAHDLCNHWKYKNTSDCSELKRLLCGSSILGVNNEFQKCTEILKSAMKKSSMAEELPGIIATEVGLGSLETEVQKGLATLNMRAVYLFDGLDEGWRPNEKSTAILGGLAIAVSGFQDNDVPIQGELVIRDNIFRSLAALDDDFSRHIEGNTLRLHWNEESLLNLVASRLRVVLDLHEVENNRKVWNRFAHRDLRDKEGFQRCLKHTLYRPRDVVVLLNQAASMALREGRPEIVEADIEATARQISLDRLADLQKEYESVFPGLAAR